MAEGSDEQADRSGKDELHRVLSAKIPLAEARGDAEIVLSARQAVLRSKQLLLEIAKDST